MRSLIALDLPAGPRFVDAVTRAWDDGDAVLPIDQRLPEPARRALVDQAKPTAVIDRSGELVRRADPAPPLDSGDALVIATSGTTGRPKLVVHTLAALTAHAESVHERLSIDPSRDRWLACLPVAHIGGLGVVIRSLLTGTGLDIVEGFDTSTVQRAPELWGTTLVSLVPTALDRIDSARFRWVVLGGATDPVRRTPNVVRTYGLTETGGGVIYDGRPLAGTEIRLDDGVISLRGPSLARGRRTSTGGVVPVTGQGGWLSTGDLGSMTATGELVVDGRRDDLIVTGGENVWPEPVEVELERHPQVADVAVIGRPDPTWGQVVTAVVVPTDPSFPPPLGALRDQVRASLPAHCAPHRLEIVTAIPRTALGKPQRRLLLHAAAPQR